jgi:hypothetical protein
VSDIHIVNHRYHVDRIADPRAQLVVLGPVINDVRVVVTEPLFESLPLTQKLRIPVHAIVRRILPYLDNAARIYFWGIQDVISFKLMLAVSGHPDVRIVPDNMEFFLRFSAINDRTVRGLTKSMIYGQLVPTIAGRVREQLGRLTFQLPPGSKIDQAHAFYNSSRWPHPVYPAKSQHVTFISQPYCWDHGIDEIIWADRVGDLLRQVEAISNLPVHIYYHPRDSSTFRARMKKDGFEETRHIGNRCIGVFSTMLFEAALAGIDVRIIFNDLKDLFGADYVAFVEWVSRVLGIALTPETAMSVSPDDFSLILPANLKIIN